MFALLLALVASVEALRTAGPTKGSPQGSPQGSHKVFPGTKLFDLCGDRVLVQSGANQLHSIHVPTGLRKHHTPQQGWLHHAVLDPTTPGRLLQHVVDGCYHTLYCGDDVVAASTRAITSFHVTGEMATVIFDTGVVDWINTKTGEARSVDAVRTLNDLPTCGEVFGGGYTALGTVTGKLKILAKDNTKRCLGQAEHPHCAAVTALCVATLRRGLHRVHVGYVDGTERRFVFDSAKKGVRAAPEAVPSGEQGDETIVVSVRCNNRFVVQTLLTGGSVFTSHDQKKRVCLPVGSSLAPVLVSERYVALKPDQASVLVYPI
jgi:hypothetical protein